MDISDLTIAKNLFNSLFPVTRSLTGDGVRETLEQLCEVTQLNIKKINSGAKVFDWEVPPEWNVNAAYIKDSAGETIVDLEESNLHIYNYSVPVDRILGFEELSAHIDTLPEMPDAIPYRTTYYERTWGFCMRHSTWESLDKNDTYEVYIDSEIDPDGELIYADAQIQGVSSKEYILSSYCCHPSLANDNLSGIILSTLLFKHLREKPVHHSYRLIIVPETIGAIVYLHEHMDEMKKVDGGYVITNVAGPGDFDYKTSFVREHAVDKAARMALSGHDFEEFGFIPSGSDERQYSSPGFRIPTGTISKDKYYEYDEYHTSKDNLSFVSAEALIETLQIYWEAIQNLEMGRIYERVDPYCEFKLDKHYLRPTTGGRIKQPGHLAGKSHDTFEYEIGSSSITTGEFSEAINWLMFGCDGETSLMDIAEESDLRLQALFKAAERMTDTGLLELKTR